MKKNEGGEILGEITHSKPKESGALKTSKTSRDENFPVGSFLIPARLRPHVMAYYNFARCADDIADDPTLSAREKVARLDELEAVLLGKKKADVATRPALALQKSLEITRIYPERATDLLIAFRQDAEGFSYHSWAELMNYCKYSAAPVGRYMLDLHGEIKEAYWPADALCSALQVINHIQDMKKDKLEMNRVYIPDYYLKKQGLTEDDLVAKNMSEGLRRAIDEMLEATQGLLREATTLPMVMFSRGLRMEVCVIHNLALRLIARLKTTDILAEHIELSKADWLAGTMTGIGNGLWRKKLIIKKK